MHTASYETYLVIAEKRNLKLLHGPDELPANINQEALWFCRLTGEIFSRAYHYVQGKDFASPGQKFWHDYKQDYYDLAEELGIEFLYDPEQDYAPYSKRTECKWRGRNGQVVVASYHQLGYDTISHKLQVKLGLAAE